MNINNYYENILNSDDNVSNSSSKLDLQRELMPLMDDPIFIGMKKPTGTAVPINRLNQSFGLTDLQLKTRGGNFANNLSQNVMLNVINNKVQLPYKIFLIIVIILIVILCFIYNKCPKVSISKDIIIVLLTILCIISTVIYLLHKKYNTYTLYSQNLPQIVADSNLSTETLSSTLPDEILKSQNEHIFKYQKDAIHSGTLGQQWNKYKKIKNTTNIVDMIKKLKSQFKNENYLAGAAKNAMSDDWFAQMLCLSYISQWGDKFDASYWQNLPQEFSTKNNLVFFDFGTVPLKNTHNNEFWNISHEIISCNGAFPSCYVFVEIGNGPTDCKLHSIIVDGKILNKNSPGWTCCKAVACMQAFILIEVFHMCMHKISQLVEISCQHQVPIGSHTFDILEPHTIYAMAAMNELESLLITPRLNNMMVFSFITDIEKFKSLLPKTVTYMATGSNECNLEEIIPWWGSFSNERNQIFENTYKPILDDKYATNWEVYLKELCLLKDNKLYGPQWRTNILKIISIDHANATFVGARLALNELWILSLGLMKKGISKTPQKWGNNWKKHLPQLDADDLTIWIVSSLATGYTTGESSGPYLLDPNSYISSIDKNDLDIIRNGFNKLVCLGEKTKTTLSKAKYKPTWIYPPNDASDAFSTLTTGTYI